MGKPTILRFFFIIAILLSPDRVHAQTGLFLDDFGASCKSIAVGQAFTAVADDFSAAYYNPAGLTQAESNFEVTLGYYYAKPMAKARMEYGPYRYDDDLTIQISGQRSSRGAIIGIASDLDFDSVIEAFPLFQRFAFGMVFWLNLPEIMTYHTGPEAYRAHYLRWDAGFALLSIVNSMACEITPWLSIGAGAIVSQKVFTQEHNMSAANKSTFFPIPGIVPDEVIGTRVSVWSKAEAFAIPLAGILVKPPIRSLQDKISLGITWRKGQKVHHGRGTQRIGFGWENDDGSFDWYLYLNDGLKTAIVGWQPTQITGSLAVRPIKGLVVSTDLTWKDWSMSWISSLICLVIRQSRK